MELNQSIIAGRLAVHPAEALFAAGLSKSLDVARKTARNKLWEGRYPFPVKVIAGQKVVLVSDLLAVLGGEATVAKPAPRKRPDSEKRPAAAEPGKRPRGRPRKVAQVAEGGQQ